MDPEVGAFIIEEGVEASYFINPDRVISRVLCMNRALLKAPGKALLSPAVLVKPCIRAALAFCDFLEWDLSVKQVCDDITVQCCYLVGVIVNSDVTVGHKG